MKDIHRFFSENDLFASHCGISLLEVSPGRARVSMEVRPFHMNGANTVHGGAIFTLADFAFAVASNSRGSLSLGINVSISYLKAATGGTLYAEAVEESSNPKLASYSVRVTGDDGELVALFQGMVYRKSRSILDR